MPKHPDLTAFVLGEIRTPEIEAHIRDCAACSGEIERIRAVTVRLQNPPELAAPALRGVPVKRASLWPRLVLAGGALVVALLLILLVRIRPAAEPLAVQALCGSPTLSGKPLTPTTCIGAGQTLETDSTSCARVKIAGLGDVDLMPGSKLRLLDSNSKSRKFALDSGMLKATVSAPPRLFVVDTPSASAVDLGCAYELSVLPTGGSRLRVTAGWVVLESRDGAAFLRASMTCESDRQGKLTTPRYDDADPAFVKALREFDERGGDLKTVLSEATGRDVLTIWHLLRKTRDRDREDVFDRLSALSPPPKGVTRQGVLNLDAAMLDAWREDLSPVDDRDFWR